ncbi:PQQ-binding-like beta-propeller repeat protein [Knoellia sp. p5-6-4]|uniref:outer membrane protein assembly factor BamB family protein n=1 Tax=unclassified Knoellia TaxID=2618719 RepID=UPI0023DAA409|nr:PQQ-binding-like beta-propeller repeat protein [Knoellia sp. p5-6-4]MDF2144110.1 PQQ-binding-like beta-propeller repeat protein [Knoellia sp. p5-6-4]
MRGVRWSVGAVGAGVALLLAACTPPGCDFDPCPPGKGWVSAVDDSGAERWRTELVDRSETAPLVTGDHVVVTGCRAVHVLDAATGRVVLSTEEVADAVGVAGGMVWGRDAGDEDGPGRGVRGVPLSGTGGQGITHAGGRDGETGDFGRTFTVSGDRLVGTHGDVLSVHPANGGPDRWVQLPVRPSQRVVMVGDRLAVAASSDGSVVGVDLEPMRLAWRVVPDQVSRRFALRVEAHGTTVLVSVLADSSAARLTEVFAVAAEDGAVLWRRVGWALATADPAVSVVTSPTAVAAVDTATGRERWSRRAAAGYTTGYRDVDLDTEQPHAGLAGDTVALPGRDLRARDVVLGVDARTGRERWRLEVGQEQAVGLDRAVGINPAEGDLPATQGQRWLLALDALSGDRLWQHQLRAEPRGEARPDQHLAADPARAQTVVADLPGVPRGGCY